MAVTMANLSHTTSADVSAADIDTLAVLTVERYRDVAGDYMNSGDALCDASCEVIDESGLKLDSDNEDEQGETEFSLFSAKVYAAITRLYPNLEGSEF